MKDFTRLLLFGDEKRLLTSQEEQFLECERATCTLFFEQYYQLYKRTPDANILEDEVKRNFIARAKVFAKKTTTTDIQVFVDLHIRKVQSLHVMKEENYPNDRYNYILDCEKISAREYFIKHDDYPVGYELLKISNSKDVVEQGLSTLLKAFYETYRCEYRRYEKRRIS